MNDWDLIKKWNGITEFGRVATQFRTLNPKALSFLESIAGLSIDNFRCYTMKQWDV